MRQSGQTVHSTATVSRSWIVSGKSASSGSSSRSTLFQAGKTHPPARGARSNAPSSSRRRGQPGHNRFHKLALGWGCGGKIEVEVNFSAHTDSVTEIAHTEIAFLGEG